MSFEEEKFRLILENEYKWPCHYLFKFIVPSDSLEDVQKIFHGHQTKVKESKKGNYVSVTCRILIDETDQVLDFYKEVSKIKGCISL